MSEDAPFTEEFAATLMSEIKRVFGEDLEAADSPKFFLLLPLVSEAEFLDFIRTVPAATHSSELVELASQYRAAHPLRNGPAE